jgi:hypothetical protein
MIKPSFLWALHHCLFRHDMPIMRENRQKGWTMFLLNQFQDLSDYLAGLAKFLSLMLWCRFKIMGRKKNYSLSAESPQSISISGWNRPLAILFSLNYVRRYIRGPCCVVHSKLNRWVFFLANTTLVSNPTIFFGGEISHLTQLAELLFFTIENCFVWNLIPSLLQKNWWSLLFLLN